MGDEEAGDIKRLEAELAQRRLESLALHSTSQISTRKEQLGRELQARFYFHDQKMFIVSAVSWVTEVGEPSVLPADIDDAALGKCVCDHLALYETIPPGDAREGNSDWGAFRVSGARSRRAFEENSYVLSAETVNTAIIIEARPRVSLHPEIAARGAGNANHAKLGNVIRQTLAAAMELRKAGIL